MPFLVTSRGYLFGLAYLKPALAAVLVFVGMKMVLTDVYKIEPLVSLAVIGVILGCRSLRRWSYSARGGGAPLAQGAAPDGRP